MLKLRDAYTPVCSIFGYEGNYYKLIYGFNILHILILLIKITTYIYRHRHVFIRVDAVNFLKRINITACGN